MSLALANLLARLYFRQEEARAVLHAIGWPPRAMPVFVTADSFWLEVVAAADGKVSDGRVKLAKAAADGNPGAAAEALALIEDLTAPNPVAKARPWEDDPPPGDDTAPAARRPGPDHHRDPHPPEPGAPPPLPGADFIGADAPCPTLMLDYADLPDEFRDAAIDVVRDKLGVRGNEVELLFLIPHRVMPGQPGLKSGHCALSIPDPGDQDEDVRREVQKRMRALDPSCVVTYRKFPFRPYLYLELIVCGPDTSRMDGSYVPATFTPEDIAIAFLKQSREAGTSGQGLVRVVIERESADGPDRLNPYATLHENGVRDRDVLRVAPDAVAGSLSPRVRMEEQRRALAQIRHYADEHSREFEVVKVDDEDLPELVTVRIKRRGLAPPADFDRFTAVEFDFDEADANLGVIPVPVAEHGVSIHFPAMFPLVAPQVVFETPVFHPNIRHSPTGALRAGALQFHPLLAGYRMKPRMADICAMITSIAAYRDYDLTEGPNSANPAAAWWAGSTVGQAVILSIGGSSKADVIRESDRRARPPRLFWLMPLGGGPDGH